MDGYPLFNSLRIAAVSTVIIFFLGILAAYYVAKLPRLVKGVLDVVLTLPLVLPPRCGLLPAAAAGPQAGAGPVVSRDLRPAADHGVVCGHLRLGGGGLPPDVPHRPGGL